MIETFKSFKKLSMVLCYASWAGIASLSANPELEEFQLLATGPVDVTQGIQRIPFTFRTRSSQVDSLFVHLYQYPRSHLGSLLGMDARWDSLAKGSVKVNGEGEIEIPAYTKPGRWAISRIVLKTKDGKEFLYLDSPPLDIDEASQWEPLPSGAMDASLEVLNSQPDNTPPEFRGFRILPARKDEFGKTYIPIETDHAVDPSGVDVLAKFRQRGEKHYLHPRGLVEFFNSNPPGTKKGRLYFDENTPKEKPYQFEYLLLRDAAGNYDYLYANLPPPGLSVGEFEISVINELEGIAPESLRGQEIRLPETTEGLEQDLPKPTPTPRPPPPPDGPITYGPTTYFTIPSTDEKSGPQKENHRVKKTADSKKKPGLSKISGNKKKSEGKKARAIRKSLGKKGN